VIASVHIADVGARAALGITRKAPKAGSIDGLRHADVGLAAPLRGGKYRPTPQPGRAALLAFWDDDAALDRFLAEHPLAARLSGGWNVRLEPLRVFGSWPGVPDDLPRARVVPHDGPAAVLTLGRVKLGRVVPFYRTSGKAERAVADAPGLIWATGLAKPPFVATCSLWDSSDALRSYAYGGEGAGHPNAIAAQHAKPFHHESAFIRFRPYDSHGALDGRNPLAGTWSHAG